MVAQVTLADPTEDERGHGAWETDRYAMLKELEYRVYLVAIESV